MFDSSRTTRMEQQIEASRNKEGGLETDRPWVLTLTLMRSVLHFSMYALAKIVDTKTPHRHDRPKKKKALLPRSVRHHESPLESNFARYTHHVSTLCTKQVPCFLWGRNNPVQGSKNEKCTRARSCFQFYPLQVCHIALNIHPEKSSPPQGLTPPPKRAQRYRADCSVRQSSQPQQNRDWKLICSA